MPRTSLEQARRESNGRLFPTRLGTLHSVVTGTGPDVVLIHGVTDNARTWRTVQDRLGAHARVHAVDLPGHGLSDTPAGGRALIIRAMGEAVLAYFDAAGIERAVVAGNSMGGGVSLAVAHLAPERVRALTLLGSVGTKIDMPRGLGLLRVYGVAELMSRAADGSFGLKKTIMRETFGPDFVVTREVTGDYFRPWRIPERAPYFRALLRALDADEPAPWLPAVRVPVHVIHGTHDRLIPIRAGRALAAAIPNARLTELPRIGHEPQIERPDECVAWLRELLA